MVSLGSVNYYNNISGKNFLVRSDVKKLSEFFEQDVEDMQEIFKNQTSQENFTIKTLDSLEELSNKLSKVCYGQTLSSKINDLIEKVKTPEYESFKKCFPLNKQYEIPKDHVLNVYLQRQNFVYNRVCFIEKKNSNETEKDTYSDYDVDSSFDLEYEEPIIRLDKNGKLEFVDPYDIIEHISTDYR